MSVNSGLKATKIIGQREAFYEVQVKIITMKCAVMQLIYFWQFPNGTVRKCPHHVDGHNYSKKQNLNEKEQNESTSTSHETPSFIVDLSLPSNSEFLGSEDET